MAAGQFGLAQNGDIQGIISKLDYIKELGCNAIWINPCFESPFGDAGYDVSDYYKVAPRYGTNDDLKELFSIAHKKNLHILLDLVPGHTSVEHPWFKESMKAEKNEYSDRYVWTDSVWEEVSGMGNLRGISDRDGSCAVNFFTHQPALNYGFYKCERPWQHASWIPWLPWAMLPMAVASVITMECSNRKFVTDSRWKYLTTGWLMGILSNCEDLNMLRPLNLAAMSMSM